MRPKSNADFNPGDDGQKAAEEQAALEKSVARKTKGVEENVRRKRLSPTPPDGGRGDHETGA